MRAGHPILVTRAYWEVLLALPAGASARSVLRGEGTAVKWVEVSTPSVLRDIDTPNDYQQALRRLID
jgi:molybdenum cofactor cytidylyltransferase